MHGHVAGQIVVGVENLAALWARVRLLLATFVVLAAVVFVEVIHDTWLL